MFRMIARLIQLLLYCTCLIVLLYLSMFYCTHHGLNLHPPSPMYMYICVFLCHVKCCSYISHLKKFTLFFPCSCHINSWWFVAAHQEFTSPAPPPNPNNFHTIDLNLLLTLSTILFEIFKMFLPTLMISKINEWAFYEWEKS